jgi:hypothetical protein
MIGVLASELGNEDGAHGITAHLGQALLDTGWTLPASLACYWVGETMGKTDFKDLATVPEKVAQTAAMTASNAAHRALLLRRDTYPGVGRPAQSDG